MAARPGQFRANSLRMDLMLTAVANVLRASAGGHRLTFTRVHNAGINGQQTITAGFYLSMTRCAFSLILALVQLAPSLFPVCCSEFGLFRASGAKPCGLERDFTYPFLNPVRVQLSLSSTHCSILLVKNRISQSCRLFSRFYSLSSRFFLLLPQNLCPSALPAQNLVFSYVSPHAPS